MSERKPHEGALTCDASGETTAVRSGGAVALRYGWRLRADDAPLALAPQPGAAAAFAGEGGGLTVERTLQRVDGALRDHLAATNGGEARRSLSVDLEIDRDATRVEAHTLSFGSGSGGVRIDLDPLAAAHPSGAEWELSLAPGERVAIGAAFEATRG